MRILGIDPGRTVGWCLLSGQSGMSGSFAIPKRSGYGSAFVLLDDWLAEVVRIGVDVIAYEMAVGPASGRILNSGMAAKILEVSYRHGLEALPVAPSHAKKVFTGSGNCKKDLVKRYASEHIAMGTWVREGELTTHEADAIAIATTAVFDLEKRLKSDEISSE